MTHLVKNPAPERRTLDEMLKIAKEWWENATPEQIEEMKKAQRESFVRAEMSWPRDCPYR